MADRDTSTTGNMNSDTNTDLARLSDADEFKVAEGYPDIRGWDVKTRDGQKVGKVKDLVVSTSQMRVRYVDLEVDKALRGDASGDDSHALLPIGSVELDDHNDNVLVSGMGTDLSSYPRYSGDQITRQYESSLRSRTAGGATGAGGMAAAAGGAIAGAATDMKHAASNAGHGGSHEFYEHDDFDDQRAFSRRRAGTQNQSQRSDSEQRITLADEQMNVGKTQVAAGEVAVRKTVETERVTQEVPVTREEVTIEHRMVPAGESQNAQIGDQEIVIPLMREEATVQKQAVVREEIVVRKQRITENQTVAADLARERLVVDGEKVRDQGSTGTMGTTGGATGQGAAGGSDASTARGTDDLSGGTTGR